MSRRTHSLNAFEVALTSGISDVDTSFPLESTEGLLAPGYLVLSPDDPTIREYFEFTAINGSNLTVPGGNRGLTGSAGSPSQAWAHLAGARVRAVAVGQWLDDIFTDIADLEAAQAAFLFLDGTRPMTGDLDMGSNLIKSLTSPVADDDGANKLYVDSVGIAIRDDAMLLDGTNPMLADMSLGGFQAKDLADATAQQDAGTLKQVQARLSLNGGTMAGQIIMDGSQIKTLANATNVSDAATLEQVQQRLGLNGGTMAGNIDMDDVARLLNLPDATTDGNAPNWGQVKTQDSFTGAIIGAGFSGAVSFRREGRMCICTISITRATTTLNGPFTIISGIPTEYQSAGATVYANLRSRFVTGVDTSEYKTVLAQMAAGASTITIETRFETSDTIKGTFAYIANGA
jgi:hypothetical protein